MIFTLIKSIYCKIQTLVYFLYNGLVLYRKRIKHGTNFQINGFITILGRGIISIGNDVRINSSFLSNPIGGDTKTIFNTFTCGEIVIGDHCGISNASILAREKVIIGNNVLIGGSTQIFDNDFHPISPSVRFSNDERLISAKPIIIQDGAFIGARCIILKGVSIGFNSVVGAGSVVTKSIPDNEIWAGNPARFIKRIPN